MNELALQEEVTDVLATAKGLVVKSNDDYKLADANCKALLELKKKIQADFRDSKDNAYAAWKSIVAQEKGHLDGIDEARDIYKNKMARYDDDQERLRLADQRRLEEQARKLAEEQALAEAVAAEARGDDEQAAQIMKAPVEAMPVYVPKSVPKSATVIRKVPDQDKIAAAVAAGVRNIPGVLIYQQWVFKVTESKVVPDQYKRVA